jgi:hypothetical protein
MIGAQIAALLFLAQAAPAAGPAASPPPAAASTQTVSPLLVTPDIPVSKRRQIDLHEVVCHGELPPRDALQDARLRHPRPIP